MMKRIKKQQAVRPLSFAQAAVRQRRYVGRASIPHADKRRRLLLRAERHDQREGVKQPVMNSPPGCAFPERKKLARAERTIEI